MTAISVIIPVYKVEEYLEKCLEGLLNQTFRDFEIILVNDGSPDKCGEICDEYKRKYENIKVIHKENQGAGFARNSGLEVASGKYIYFCDPDDYVEPNLLEDNFYFAEKYDANMVIFGHYDEVFTNKGQFSKPAKLNSSFMESQTDFRNGFEQLYRQNIMYTLWNKLYKKEYLDLHHCQFGNQKIGEDTLFNYKIYEELDRVYCNDKMYYHYVINRTSSATNAYKENRFQMRYEETSVLEDLIAGWGYSEQYNQLILNDWIMTLFHGMNNLFLNQCPYVMKDKKKQLESMVNTPKFKSIFSDVSSNEIYSKMMKLVMIFIGKKQYSLALYTIKISTIIKAKAPKLKELLTRS